jgi:ABC-type phosphate transport system substrate-binding protein
MILVRKSVPWFTTVLVLLAYVGWGRVLSIRLNAEASAESGRPIRTLVFVVNKVSPVDNLSPQDLRRVFLGERTKWPDGHKITVVMQDQGTEGRDAFLRLVCHMNESDYTRYVLQAAFTGAVQGGPRVLSSAAGVVKFVSLVPGAIGYVCSGETDDSVKIIKVDGVSPNAAGYKFGINKLEKVQH